MNIFEFVITLIFIFVALFVFFTISVDRIRNHITTVVIEQFNDFKSDIKKRITDLILQYIKTECKHIQLEGLRTENKTLWKQIMTEHRYIKSMSRGDNDDRD